LQAQHPDPRTVLDFKDLECATNTEVVTLRDILIFFKPLEIKADHCNIDQLDDDHFGETGNVMQIINLTLSDNIIKKIDSFAFLGSPNLQCLSLARNKITFVHRHAFTKQASLKFLDLSGNQLKKLDNTIFTNCVALSVLNMSYNSFSTLNLGMFNNTGKLRDLDLNHNQLVKIEPITKILKIKRLHLSHNQLTDVSALEQIKKLIFLDVSDNGLQQLSFNEGNFENQDDIKRIFPKFTTIDVSHNKWSCDYLAMVLGNFEKTEIEVVYVDEERKEEDGTDLEKVGCLEKV
jgi:Leucine-rich repeat (LRR) protein